ncbi:MAG: DNA polymerase III subunit epsilon [Beijerinckiaceae bacterium]
MREIIFDTETTGLSPREGHRLVEIGCIEMVNRFATGRVFHKYLNPERDMPIEAFDIHGLSSDFLRDKELFAGIADEFEEFLGDAQLVAHNAGFDIGFINAEFAKVGKAAINMDRVVDTVQLARRKFPGGKNSLDALCDRFGIDRSQRIKHGALLDAEILAEVYAELLGGKQTALVLDPARAREAGTGAASAKVTLVRPQALEPLLQKQDVEAHAAFVSEMGDKAIWNRYIKRAE